jgi:hypothetical protein
MSLKREFEVDTVMESALMTILSAKAQRRTKTILDKDFFRSGIVVHDFCSEQFYALAFGLLN